MTNPAFKSNHLTDSIDYSIVLAVNDVEPGLVKATKKLSRLIGRKLTGVVIVDQAYAKSDGRAIDKTGFFKEIIVDFSNKQQLKQVIQPISPHLLVATCRIEWSVQYFQKLLPVLPKHLFLPDQKSLKWSTEKDLMRKKLTRHSPEINPRFAKLRKYSAKQVNRIDKEFNYPIITKPVGLAMSLLVNRCDNKTELEESLKITFDKIDEIYKRDFGRGDKAVLVEEMIQGDMYSIDAYVDNQGTVFCLPLVHVVTAHSIGKNGFYSYQLNTEVDLSYTQEQQAQKAVIKSIEALRLKNSTAHVELFYDGMDWKIIELGPRIGGYREDLYREAYGIDHYLNDLLIRIGQLPQINRKSERYASGINIYAEEEGTIKKISGQSQAKQLESVIYIKQHLKAGQPAKFATNGGHFIFDGILSNSNKATLQNDLNAVRRLINIEVE